MLAVVGALASLAIALSLVFLAVLVISVVFLIGLACLAGTTGRHPARARQP
jgi:hypothetical protein